MKHRVIFFSFLTFFYLSACSTRNFENSYNFPAEGLTNLVGQDEGIRLSGFSEDLCVPVSDSDLNTEGVRAEMFGLFSLDEAKVLSQHNIYKQANPASTTKILTCLLALEYGTLDEIVTVPDEAMIDVSGSSMADLEPGDRLTLRDLLYGLMVPSGNDAAVAIAYYVSGSLEAFSQLMNIKAAELGATHSHFTNPHGLTDENHYTTVYDMYLIFNEAIKLESFREISSKAEYSCTINSDEESTNEERTITWTSGNGFYNGEFSFAQGMDIFSAKTGHTYAAGFCLVCGESDTLGNEYISIIFDSEIYEYLYSDMKTLVEKGLD